MAHDVVFLTQKEDPTMARRRGHTEEQILAVLRQAARPWRRSVGTWGSPSRRVIRGSANMRDWG
jgi:hypothetical protein